MILGAPRQRLRQKRRRADHSASMFELGVFKSTLGNDWYTQPSSSAGGIVPARIKSSVGFSVSNPSAVQDATGDEITIPDRDNAIDH